MNMKYQRGRTSFFTIMISAAGAMWLFGMFDNDEGKASVDAAINNLEGTIVQLEQAARRIQKGIQVSNEREVKAQAPVETIRRAAEAQGDNIPPVETKEAPKVYIVVSDTRKLEPQHIPNRIRDKSRHIQLPLTKEYYPRRHSDGTLWGCKADESNQTVCYPVSD